MRPSLKRKLLLCLLGIALVAGTGLGIRQTITRTPRSGPRPNVQQGNDEGPAAGITPGREARSGEGEGVDSMLLVAVF